MSMTGQLYRIFPSRLRELLADPAQVEADLYPDEYPANVHAHGADVEKTWDAINFILDRLANKGKIRWVSPLTGGNETGGALHYGPVWYRAPDEVAEIAEVLGSISRDDFHQEFVPELMSENNIYPGIWDDDDSDGLFEYVWQHYEPMVEFYRSAARGGDAVLLHLA